MSWLSSFRSLFKTPATKKQLRTSIPSALTLEMLEERLVPYSVTGNAWTNPQLITISFMPDGTQLSSAVGSTISSNLFSALNAKFGSAAVWQAQILKAAQVWAQQTNINFTVVPDNGAPSGSGNYAQGDPGFGDIRIGGYNFGTSTLGNTFYPPNANNYSIAGDVAFNTGQVWNMGSTYDLFTVATHEIGHALGLGESSASTSAIMYGSYTGVKTGLAADDIAGIQTLYGTGRTPDAYDTAAGDHTLGTAANLSSLINPVSLTALVNNLNLNTTSDSAYYTFTAPTATSSTLQVQVQSQGLSLLSPKVTVFAANGTTVLGTASGLNQYGTTLDVTVTGVTAGQQFYVKVQGADTSAFSTGAYALALNFCAGTTPLVNEFTGYGVYRYSNTSGWQQLTTNNASQVAVDTNGDVYAAFPGAGILRVTNTSGWQQLTTANASQLAVNASGEVVAALTGYGVYRYTSTSGWQQLTTASASQVAVNASGEVLVTLAGYGEYRYTDASGWQKLTPNVAAQIGLDDNGNVFAAFAGAGVSRYTDSNGWQQLSTANAAQLAVSGGGEVVAVLTGYGVYSYTNNNGWQQLTPNNVSQVAVDAHGNVTAASASAGEMRYTTASGWQQLTTANAAQLAVASGATPVASSPIQEIANGTPLTGSGGVANNAGNGNVYQNSVPVITGITPDNGLDPANLITNSQNISLLGTASANNIVNVYAINLSTGQLTLLGTALAGGNNWTFNYTGTTLAPGSYSFTASATDPFGNVSNLANSVTVTIDTSIPQAPTCTGITPDTGCSATDDITNVTTPTLQGTAPLNTLVQIFQNKGSANGLQLVGSTMTSNHGTWSLPTNLQPGAYNFVVRDESLAGNFSLNSAPFSVTIDNTVPAAPAITGISPDTGIAGDGATNSPNITLLGTATANTSIQVFNGGVAVGTTTASSSGTWQLQTTLSQGTYQFTAQATEIAGNVSGLARAYPVVIQTAAPAAPVVTSISNDTGVSASDFITNVQAQGFNGTGSAPNGTVQVFLDAHAIGTTTANNKGGWSFDYSKTPIGLGTHTITAQVTDYVGNVSPMSAPVTLVIDLTIPDMPVITSWGSYTGTLGTNSSLNVNTPYFVGTAAASSTVTVMNNGQPLGTATTNAAGVWQFISPALLAGPYSISATATDLAGNTSQPGAAIPITITSSYLAPSAPSITGLTPQTDSGVVGDNVTNIPNIQLTGTAIANSTVVVFSSGAALGTTNANGNGIWTFDNSQTTLTPGSYSFTAADIDANGNVSPLAHACTVVLQTAAPAAPHVTSISSDSGTSSTDFITNVQTQIFGGTSSTPNGTVQVFLDGHALGTTATNNIGVWSFDDRATPISPGTHTVSAQVTDSAGNVSPVSASLTLVIDLTAPNAPSITSWGPDTGVSATDGITNVNTPTFYGQGPANNTVTVMNNGRALGTTTANASGAWQFTAPSLPDGVASITATDTEVAGNVSQPSYPLTFTVITKAPLAPAITGITPDSGTPGDGVTRSQNLMLLGTGVANATVFVLNNGTSIGTTKANGSGAWTFDYSKTTLAAGTYQFTAETIDVAGNVSLPSRGYTAVIDLTAPAAPAVTGISNDSGVSATDNITNVQYQTFYGSSIPNGAVQVFLDGHALGAATAGVNGAWSFNYSTTALQAGTHTATAQVTDSVGNLSALSAPYTLVIDLTAPNPPSLTAFSPVSAPNTTNLNTPTIFGTAEPNSVVTVLDNSGHATMLGTTTASAAGAWQFTCSQLSNAVHSITAMATDIAGNTSQASALLPLTVATGQQVPNTPSITGMTPDSGTAGDGVTNSQNIKLLGTGDGNIPVKVFCNAILVGLTTSNSSGAWTFDYSHTTLAPGSYSFTAQESNAAGAGSQLSHVYTAVIQTTPPAAPTLTSINNDSGVSNTDWITNVQGQVFNGTSIPNALVQVFLDGHALGTTTVNNGGTWSFDYTKTNISQGTHTVAAQVTDYVGNVSALSAPKTLVIDQTTPNQPILTSWGPDTGVSSTDGITDVNTPTLYGTAEASSIVTVLNNGHAVGSTTTNANGAWQFTSAALPDGVESITATATDLAGNTGKVSNSLSFTIITKTPQSPTITGITPDSGTAGDGVTNSQNIKIVGTGVANATVMVLSNGNSIGTTQVGGNGTWTFDYSHTTLAGGIYTFTAKTLDVAGNLSQPSFVYTVVIDLTPPAAPTLTNISNDSGVNNADWITNVQGQVFNGTSIPKARVQVFLDGHALGTTTANDGGTWSFDYSRTNLNQGTHTVTAQATDSVGNVSPMSAPKTLVIDLTAPDQPSITSWGPDTGVSATDGITNVNTPTLYGTVEPYSTVTVSDGGHALGTTTANANGAWQFTASLLNDGVHTLTATATDLAGNTGQPSQAIHITIVTKIGNPLVQGITPDTGLHNNDGITNSRNISILGQSDPNDVVQVFQNGMSIGTTTANSQGNWTFNDTGTTLTDGVYNFAASAADLAGNVTAVSNPFAVTIDTATPSTPVIAGVAQSNGANGGQTLTLTGTALAQGQVTVYLAGTALGTTNVNGQGSWNFNYNGTSFANGTYLFTAQSEDLAGNLSTLSPSFNLLLGNGMQNLSAPHLSNASIVSVDSTGNATAIATPTFTGNAKAGTLVTIVDNGGVLGTAVANSSGQWTFTSTTLAKGRHNVSVFASDALGNEGLLSNSLGFQV